MLRPMTKRTPAVRCLAILWATLQLASPGAIAIADGRASEQGASAAFSHIESSTTSSCPEIHGVDCALCRYVSNAAAAVPSPSRWYVLSVELPRPGLVRVALVAASRALPHGRAPPTI